MTTETLRFGRRVLITVVIVALFIAAVYALDLILLVFAGILLAIFFRTIGSWIHSTTRIRMSWCMAAVLLTFVGLLFGTTWMFGSQIAEQANELVRAVSHAAGDFQHKLRQIGVDGQVTSESTGITLGELAKSATSGLIWLGAAAVLVLFLGVYLSTNPELYTETFLSFFGPKQRTRMISLLEAAADALRWWLLGQLIAMAVVGIITTVGLLLIQSPMAISLGVLAMLLTFVPYAGALVSAIPAMLIALTQSRDMVLWVMLIYLVAHIVEGYIVVPLIQHRLVYLPPALILATQFLVEVFAGFVGVTFATPLMVVAMVLIKRLYFKQDWTEEVEGKVA
jgi:predicted PurR-regulated permease PerM